jgi:dipeptidyl-peptidase-4
MSPFRRTLAAALAFAALPTNALAQEETTAMKTAEADTLSFERVFASPSLNGPAPRLAKLSPDGRYLTLLRNRDDEKDRYDLWAFDREAGEWRMLVDSEALGTGRELSEGEKMRRERQRIAGLRGIVSYDWAADGSGILVPIEGDLYLARLDGSVERLTQSEQDELSPKLSETGRYVSFLRDRRLWVGEVGGEARAITPEEGETVRWGEAEFVAQEEMSRNDGYWWSPHDRRIAVERFDEAAVGIVTRAAIGASGTRTYEQRYPAAGTPNVDVSLVVMDPDGGNSVEVDLGQERDIYLVRVDWAPDGETLYVQRVDRGQTRLDVLAADPATGATRLLFSEQAAEGHWINLSHSYKFLDDGRGECSAHYRRWMLLLLQLRIVLDIR